MFFIKWNNLIKGVWKGLTNNKSALLQLMGGLALNKQQALNWAHDDQHL